MDEALHNLRVHIATCEQLENNLRGKATSGPSTGKSRAGSKAARKEAAAAGSGAGNGSATHVVVKPVAEILQECVAVCKRSRKRHHEENAQTSLLGDDSLSQFTRFTDQIAMDSYAQFLHYVPRLVNVVTLAEALPMPGSGLSLPLNLSKIASCCKGSFYAPRRFAAVQLAYSEPRCRVLVFHTGRLVGTGTCGPAAARLAILRAQRQLAEEANVHLHIRNFSVINSVGAVSLKATLNCDAFATEHSGESHFDRSSFVGLAWRPPREHICCEIYSTGKANLPGSVAERQLLESFSRMLPELLRFSSANHLLALIPEEMQAHHKIVRASAAAAAAAAASSSSYSSSACVGPNPPAKRQYVVANRARQRLMGVAPAPKQATGLWDGWEDAEPTDATQLAEGSDSDEHGGRDDGLDLAALGL